MAQLFAGFNYNRLDNLGDYIQSIAAEQFIPAVQKRFNRDNLREVRTSRNYFLIMNGWFTHTPNDCFPLSNNLNPIFWGMHITDWNDSWQHLIFDPATMDYFKQNQPIGCRDRFTQERLAKQGIEAFYSKCLTLTFPRRIKKIRKGWNVVVDVPIPLPPHIESNSIRLTHTISGTLSETKKRQEARKSLDFYRNHAAMIITTRLHCALPCIAMGIPVIFFGNPRDYRISILEDIGLHINRFPTNYYTFSQDNLDELTNIIWNKTNWAPTAIDFEDSKAELILQFKKFLENKLNHSN